MIEKKVKIEDNIELKEGHIIAPIMCKSKVYEVLSATPTRFHKNYKVVLSPFDKDYRPYPISGDDVWCILGAIYGSPAGGTKMYGSVEVVSTDDKFYEIKENITTLLVEYRKRVEEADKIIKPLKDKLLELEEQAKELCPHEFILKETEYVEGGYLDKSQTIITVKCSFCHKVLNTDTKFGNYA